jgi:plasmid maintenance system antidote protein VapI
MTFQAFRRLLLQHIGARLRNGEWTERGFARQVGISQPHVHHILNGARPLTTDMADRILAHLGLDLLRLASPAELRRALEQMEPATTEARTIPRAAGALAPHLPCPVPSVVAERITVAGRHAAWVNSLREPVFLRLGEDAELPWPGAPPRLALLETCARVRRYPSPDAWYAIRLPAGGAVRQVRWVPPVLTVLGQLSLLDSVAGSQFTLDPHGLERVLLGRVVWLGRSPDRRFEFDYDLWPVASR